MSREEADALRRRLYRAHGNTLRGMMRESDAEPHAYLDFVFDLPDGLIAPPVPLAGRFLPGLGLSILLFDKTAEATRLPMEMDRDSILQIFILTLVMCAGSGLLTLRKLRGIDPAEVF